MKYEENNKERKWHNLICHKEKRKKKTHFKKELFSFMLMYQKSLKSDPNY